MGRKLAPRAVPYLRADGVTTWRVRLRSNGQQTTETFHSETAANAFISQVVDPHVGPERAIELRNRVDSRSAEYMPTLREVLENHIETLTGVDQRTREDYLSVAKRSWLPFLGTMRVDEIRRDDIARWVNKAAGTVSPKTIRNAHSVLSAALNTAMLDGHIAANPARGTRLPRAGEEDVEEIKFLTHAEFDRLFAEIPERDDPMVVWMFGMGTRYSETTAVQVRDVDLSSGQIVGNEWISAPETRIVRAWKGAGRLGPPKSRAGRRTVVMPAEVVDAVDPLLSGRPGSAFLFQTTTGKPVSHSNFFNRIWKPATLRASICEAHRVDKCRCLSAKPYLCTIHTATDAKGVRVLPDPCGCVDTLPFRPRIHDARHTHASWLIAQGIPLNVIQDRLGHEDYLTTQRLYGHLMPDARYQAGVAASLAFAATAIAGRPRALPPGQHAEDD